MNRSSASAHLPMALPVNRNRAMPMAMPRTDDEPNDSAEEREPGESEEHEREPVPGSVGPTSPLDSGLFWLS